MLGQQVSRRVWRAWACAVLSVISALAVAASPLMSPDVQQAAQCRLVITGLPDGRLRQASMHCTGSTPPTVALNATHLGSYAANFTGVRLADSCPSKVTVGFPCLITICSGSLQLRRSRVSRVRNVLLEGLVCVAHSTRLEVHNSRFIKNQVRPLVVGDQAVMVLHASNVSSNIISRETNGGGMLVDGNASVTITDGSLVQGNLVGGNGGGMTVLGNARVSIAGGSVVSNNTATWSGGGLAMGENTNVTLAGGSRVHGNRAGQGGGGLAVGGGGTLVVANGSSISNNAAALSGGGLYAVGNASVTLLGGSRVHGNVASIVSGGGVCVIEGAQFTIINSSVHDNRALNNSGGGLSASGRARVSLADGSVVSNNTAAQSGGGLLAYNEASVTITRGSRVLGNMAYQRGGGLIVFDDVVLVVAAASISNNTAQAGGGLDANGNSSVTITGGSRLRGNRAGLSGGGIFVSGDVGLVVANGSSISNNTAAWNGGGLYAGGNASVTILGGSRVHANIASNHSGGGVCVVEGAQLTIINSSVHGNRAQNDAGGGLIASGSARVSLADGTIVSSNTAAQSGGGLAALGNASVTLTGGSRVHGNIASHYSGGGVCVIEGAQFTIINSSVHNNRAQNNDGGGLSVGGSAHLSLADGSVVSNNTAAWAGGGLYAGANASVSLLGGSRVHGNTASKFGGGGVFVAEDVQLTIINSSVHDNRAQDDSGGGLFANGRARVSLADGSVVSNNTASSGGGLYAGANASITLLGGSRVYGNTASSNSGGGVWVIEGAYLTIKNSSLHGNHAVNHSGGGLSVGSSARVSLADGSVVSNNTAAWGGGGLVAYGSASVTISGGSRVHQNIASISAGGGVNVMDGAQLTIIDSAVHGNHAQHHSGGGVSASDSARVDLTDGSVVSNNTAAKHGGGLYADANASVTITRGSRVLGNRAGQLGGGLLVIDDVVLVVSNGTSISNNTAAFFGGALTAVNASVTITGGSRVHGNMAGRWGGGLVVVDLGRLVVNDSIISNNTAALSGGGLLAMGDVSVTLTGGSRVHGNQALNGSGGGVLVIKGVVLTINDGCNITNNICTKGVGGGIAVGADNQVDLGLRFGRLGLLEAGLSLAQANVSTHVTISSSTIANNTSNRAAGGGLALFARSVVAATNGTKVEGNTAISGSGGAVFLTGDAVFETDSTVVFANNSVPPGFVGSTIVALETSKLSLPGRNHLTRCNNSVYLGRTPCETGEVLQHGVCMCCPAHTFTFGTSNCTRCPANADCPGANIVEPLPGFWSSSNTSIQMHRCPLSKIACHYENQTHMCKPGYKGPLCGDCQLPIYGMLSPMRCGKCMSPAVHLWLFLLFCFVGVLFVSITVHLTRQDNLKGTRAVFITDYIKVLVQFLQYIAIIGSVSVPWPLFDVQQWLLFIGIFVTMGSGQALSLDCWLFSYGSSALPIAIQRMLVYFLVPVFVLVAVLALPCLVWAVQRWVVPLIWKQKEGAGARKPFMFLRRLPVTVLVVVFYAYPILARASLSFFACLRIDKPLSALIDVPESATALLSHRWGYWVSSIEQECFAGYLLGWSLGLGLPSIILWCIIVPAAMGVGLYLCKDGADTDSFREHFGFLYRTYKPERMWWEAVWAARTVVLTLISVFAFPMQRYYSVLSLLLVFWVSAALQNGFQPYEFATLHRMHLVSTSCLAATTMGALAMFAYDIEEATANGLRIAIAVLVLAIDLGFVVWCIVSAAPALKEGYVGFVKVVKGWATGVVHAVNNWVGHAVMRKGSRGSGRGSSRRGSV